MDDEAVCSRKQEVQLCEDQNIEYIENANFEHLKFDQLSSKVLKQSKLKDSLKLVRIFTDINKGLKSLEDTIEIKDFCNENSSCLDLFEKSTVNCGI